MTRISLILSLFTALCAQAGQFNGNIFSIGSASFTKPDQILELLQTADSVCAAPVYSIQFNREQLEMGANIVEVIVENRFEDAAEFTIVFDRIIKDKKIFKNAKLKKICSPRPRQATVRASTGAH
ncbi:MAG: hypothetical protein A4S09_09310 [Proteobacteria bacterium SG_bin7]|nr:MAG: hypothetical protein A4S09_09310 [Proteobacteria bacterium SG_bin7]